MRYFSSPTWRAVVSCTTWMVPFCWPPCSAYDEVETIDCAAKTRIHPFRQPRAAFAIGAAAPGALLRQNLFTQIAQYIRRRFFQALQQSVIGLEDAEVCVVRQNQILDGIEGIHPLPLRAQHLLQQAQILHRDTQRLRRRFQKLQFFADVAAACSSRATASRSPTSCPAPAAAPCDEWRASPVVPAPAPRSPRVSITAARFSWSTRACVSAGSDLCPMRSQRFRRQAGVLGWHQMVVFHQTGTTPPSPPLRLSVFPARSASSGT